MSLKDVNADTNIQSSEEVARLKRDLSQLSSEFFSFKQQQHRLVEEQNQEILKLRV